ncbi:MAG: RsmE family RNA methyltransferase [Myxococcota bacterium]
MRQLYHPLPADPAQPFAVASVVRHRLERVLRLPQGARLVVADGSGWRLPVRWHFDHFEPDGPLRSCRERPWVELGIGLVKGDRWEWLVEKCVEAGVDRLVPLQLDHCVVRVDPARAGDKVQRWQAVAIEAFEQCGRDRLPQILPPAKLETWLDSLGDVTLCACDETDPPTSLLQLVQDRHPARLALLVGPEGGLAAAEQARARTAGAVAVTLGPHVLRAETAAMIAVAIARAAFHDGFAIDPPNPLG